MPVVKITCDTVDELSATLQFGYSLWKDASFSQIGFRGQGDSNWRLMPQAFRACEALGYSANAASAPLPDIASQCMAEYSAVRTFVEFADRVGLDLPGDASSFRMLRELAGPEADDFWREKWPQDRQLQLLAIAQHHGVPTRLVDFTYDPLVALYFAARSAYDRIKGDEPAENFAVWVVDLRFVRKVWARTPGYPERIREIVVPRFGNNFLQAQQAFFLVDVGANKSWESSPQPLDAVLEERVDYWSLQKGAWPTGDPTDTHFLPLVKVEVPIALVVDVLRFLHNRGIHQATLMPSHDRVVEALKFMRDQGHEVE